jgi:hypothetical protein
VAALGGSRRPVRGLTPRASQCQQTFGQVRRPVTGLAEVTGPRQHGQHRDRQHRGELVTDPLRRARVDQLTEQLPQRADDLLTGTVMLDVRH